MNPNVRFGRKSFPAAPIELRAFIIALRLKNEKWIIEEIKRLVKENVQYQNPIIQRLLFYVEQGRLFTCIAIHCRWGSELIGKNINWHKDSAASLLHIGISIKGKRALHYLKREDNDVNK